MAHICVPAYTHLYWKAIIFFHIFKGVKTKSNVYVLKLIFIETLKKMFFLQWKTSYA